MITKLHYLHIFGKRQEGFCMLVAVSAQKNAIFALKKLYFWGDNKMVGSGCMFMRSRMWGRGAFMFGIHFSLDKHLLSDKYQILDKYQIQDKYQILDKHQILDRYQIIDKHKISGKC